MNPAARPSRRAPALAFLVGGLCAGCGDDRPPPEANSRGVWLYGASDSSAGTSTKVAIGPFVAPPPKSPTSETAAVGGGPASTAAPSPAPGAGPAPRVPSAPAAPEAGAYAVVAVRDGGAIRVTCTLTGAPPAPEPVVAFKHREFGCRDHVSERVRYAKRGDEVRLGNCVVYLRSILEGKDWPDAMRGVDRSYVIDQKACVYLPHVGWARAATQVVVVNSDRAEHNIHTNRGSDLIFNFGSAPGSRLDSLGDSFLERLGLYDIKCDIHPWMNAYLHLMPHPYVAVTAAADAGDVPAGEVTLDAVPPGSYEVVCWHEGMKTTIDTMDDIPSGYRFSPEIVLTRPVTVTPNGRHDIAFQVPHK